MGAWREKEWGRFFSAFNIYHCCGRDGLNAFHGLSLFTKWWDGTVCCLLLAACGGDDDVCCASPSCTAGATSSTSHRETERYCWRGRLCQLRLLHLQTQQTILSSRETRVHDRGVRRAAVGCLGLSRLSLRVAAGVNCASVLGDCHHFNVFFISFSYFKTASSSHQNFLSFCFLTQLFYPLLSFNTM